MRVIHVGKYFPPVPGGIETAVAQICRGLSNVDGVEVACVVSHTQPSLEVSQIGRVKLTRLPRHGLFASTPITFGYNRIVSEFKPDVVHVHLPNPLVTVGFLTQKVPMIATYHCDILRYPTILKLYRPAMDLFLKRVRKIIVTSDELVQSSPVLSHYREKCVVIPLAVSTEHLELNELRRIQVEQVHKKFGDRIVLFVGRLVNYKGLDHLIQAIKNVSGRLLIIGDGPERERLITLSRELNVDSKVDFLGYVNDSDLGAYYRACSVVALTSVDASEAFGMCLLDGLACGKPLFTTRLSTGVKKVNISGVTGLDAEVGDIKTYSELLNRLLQDRDLRKRLGDAGLKHFNENFDWRLSVDSHMNLYQSVLAR